MGLFDQILGAVTGGTNPGNTNFGNTNPSGTNPGGTNPGAAAGPAALLEAIMNHEGGLQGLVQKFNDAGLGNVVNSWIGNGQNAQISADTVHQVLGSDVMRQIAARTGLPLDQVGNMVAEHLPRIVDGVTPNGQVEATQGDDLLALGASFLKGRFGIG